MKHTRSISAREQLDKIRRLMERSRSPLKRMTQEQLIQALRKTREELWEEKIAPRTR